MVVVLLYDWSPPVNSSIWLLLSIDSLIWLSPPWTLLIVCSSLPTWSSFFYFGYFFLLVIQFGCSSLLIDFSGWFLLCLEVSLWWFLFGLLPPLCLFFYFGCSPLHWLILLFSSLVLLSYSLDFVWLSLELFDWFGFRCFGFDIGSIWFSSALYWFGMFEFVRPIWFHLDWRWLVLEIGSFFGWFPSSVVASHYDVVVLVWFLVWQTLNATYMLVHCEFEGRC
jgi:hypothetical protein